MFIKVQLSDKVYEQMVATGRRVEGSIGMVNPKEGNFNAYKRQSWQRRETGDMVKQLEHGRVRVSDERVSLRVRIKRPSGEMPSTILDRETQQAVAFVFETELIDSM